MADFNPALLTFDGDANVYVLDDADIDTFADEGKAEDGPKADPLGILGNLDRAPRCEHTRCTHARRAHIRSPVRTPSETSSEGAPSEDDSHSAHSEHSEHSAHSDDRTDNFEDVRAALNAVEQGAIKPDFKFGKWPTKSTEQPPPCVDSLPRPKSLFRRQAKA